MMKVEGKVLFVFASLIAVCFGYHVWPEPAIFIRGGDINLAVLPDIQFQLPTRNTDLLNKTVARYMDLIFPFPTTNLAPNMSQLTSVSIQILSLDETLQFGVNENYSVVVKGSSAVIEAPTIFGAMRGLETFAQLIDYDWENNWYTISDTPIIVDDYPRFPWRGLMIDTGRHYLHPQTILTMIDAVSYNKLNTLHWHITDIQSFPFISETYPLLAEKGAWAYPAATYNHSDVQMIVQYGYERGVRVVPEFDMPGHAYSWGLGYPDVIINCTAVVPDWGTSGCTLDIISNYTYEFLDNFMQELDTLFIDDYMHFGSDEVNYQCWNHTEYVVEWMTQMGFTEFVQLEQYFEDRLQVLTNKNQINHRVFWEDAFANGVIFDNTTTTLEIWLSLEHLVQSVLSGFKTILAMGFYLDVQKPGNTVHYEWVDTWQDFYTNEPFSGVAANLTDEQKKLVIGGELCMWGEAVEDENIFSRVWVRGSGGAEKLWSTYNYTMNFNSDLAQTRLIEFRCRLKQRGIHATALRPDWCPLPPFMDD